MTTFFKRDGMTASDIKTNEKWKTQAGADINNGIDIGQILTGFLTNQRT